MAHYVEASSPLGLTHSPLDRFENHRHVCKSGHFDDEFKNECASGFCFVSLGLFLATEIILMADNKLNSDPYSCMQFYTSCIFS